MWAGRLSGLNHPLPCPLGSVLGKHILTPRKALPKANNRHSKENVLLTYHRSRCRFAGAIDVLLFSKASEVWRPGASLAASKTYTYLSVFLSLHLNLQSGKPPKPTGLHSHCMHYGVPFLTGHHRTASAAANCCASCPCACEYWCSRRCYYR